MVFKMSLSHNQMAYAAIISTLIFGSLFVGFSGFFQTSEGIGGFESAAEDDLIGSGTSLSAATDTDEDGLSDLLESTQYGTDPENPDTDFDGMSDGWEVAHGLNPLDNGESEDLLLDPTQAEDTQNANIENESDSWPDPEQGPNGDPDHDGLTNQAEQELGTDPQRSDTDNDNLNDLWESMYTQTVQTPGGNVTLFDPLNGNWDCLLLDQAMEDTLSTFYDSSEGALPSWDELGNAGGMHSCDMVLDTDEDGLPNFQEETYGTNPTSRDSDMDLLDDIVEIGNLTASLLTGVGENCNVPLLDPIVRQSPFAGYELSWFLMDMDDDGFLNGPSDWDTDGDGMPDGFEFCYSNVNDHPQNDAGMLLNPANASDGYGDWDEDGLNNFEEYQVANLFGPTNFTSPWRLDTDLDGMPDGWESTNGLHPRDGSNGNLDPDHDGWDVDRDGGVFYSTLESTTIVVGIDVLKDSWVEANSTVARGQITLAGGQKQTIAMLAPVSGYVYQIDVSIGQAVDSRLFRWMEIVEPEEQFTNLMEYNARDRDGDGIIDGRSTDPLNPDTDGDGLMDGIEVMGWEILVVNNGIMKTWVTSDPGLFDTDEDGLSDFDEFSSGCGDGGSNASNPDTDGDGELDQIEALTGYSW
ncbi:MAG: hypothetical protein ACI8T6_000508, partial [Candidatus Poseidoniaceae archaeon]